MSEVSATREATRDTYMVTAVIGNKCNIHPEWRQVSRDYKNEGNRLKES